jgi:LysM repeat protein
MKRITPVLLTAFSVLALSLPLTSHADNDGFLVFEATDATQAVTAAPAEVVQTEVQATTPETVVQDQSVTAVEAPADDAAASTVQAQEVAVKAAPKAEKKAVKKAKKAKKAKKKVQKRSKRAKRSARAKRTQRSSNIRKAKYYKIRKGDTLYRISVKSGVRMSRLVKLNKLHGSKKHNIQAGQRIRLR